MRCMAVAARPLYSSGQCTAAQRPSLSTRCQLALRCCTFSVDMAPSSASSSLARNGSRCSSSHARNSSRNASSSGARAKSTGRDASRAPVYTVGQAVNGARGERRGFHIRCGAAGLAGRGPPGHGRGRPATLCVAWPTILSGSTPGSGTGWSSSGWTGMLQPGSGGGLLEMCIVLEQMGRVPLPGPVLLLVGLCHVGRPGPRRRRTPRGSGHRWAAGHGGAPRAGAR